ncbi:MAG: hypothetical protein DRG39_04680 [Deltaproteobacteria bacterium]|nr:MAG: hypothetical protein DRG39_04680 [Deltaproteobacteria bacterium]
MINFLKIRNFQSHKNTEINFSPGVNVIIGLSDTGKSSILRALRWVVENRPAGFAFRPWFAKKGECTEVTVGLPEVDVRRVRSSTENLYWLGEEKLEGFGQDVPERVKEVLNLGEGCFQKQLDPVFLLTDSPGEVARTLNRVTRLDEIDALLSNLASLNNSVNRERKLIKADLDDLKGQLVEFKDLPAIERIIEGVEEASAQLRKNKEDFSAVLIAVNEVEKVEEELGDLDDFLAVEKEYEALDSLFSEYQSLAEKALSLSELVSSVEDIEGQLEEIPDIDEGRVDAVRRGIEEKREVDSRIGQLAMIMENVYGLEDEISEIEERIVEAENDYGLKISEAEDLVCPVVAEFGKCIYGYERRVER